MDLITYDPPPPAQPDTPRQRPGETWQSFVLRLLRVGSWEAWPPLPPPPAQRPDASRPEREEPPCP